MGKAAEREVTKNIYNIEGKIFFIWHLTSAAALFSKIEFEFKFWRSNKDVGQNLYTVNINSGTCDFRRSYIYRQPPQIKIATSHERKR